MKDIRKELQEIEEKHVVIYTFYVSTNSIGSEEKEDIEITLDKPLNEYSPKELDNLVNDYYQDWVGNNVNMSYWKKKI